MSDSRLAVIANPASGRGKGRRYMQALLGALGRKGSKPQVLQTAGRGHGEQLAHQALDAGARTVVACGGDGTVHEVAQALAGSPARLAVGPAGRRNDFARSLGPLLRPEELSDCLANGHQRQWDLIKANGRYACTVAAVGYDAEVTAQVDRSRLPLPGIGAYLWAVVSKFLTYRPPELEVAWDQGRRQGPLLLAAVANTPTYGDAIPIVPHAKPDDGRLDICLVDALGFLRMLRCLPKLLKGSHGELPEVSFVSTAKVTISSQERVEVWADGEPLGATPITMQVAPGALTVMPPE